MIVAERKEYYNFPRKEVYRDKKNLIKDKTKKARARERVKVIGKAGLAFLIAFTIILRFSVISEYSFRINRLSRELGQLQKINERLHLQLAAVQDIGQIEEYAREKLGMVYPDNSDIIYVAVNGVPEETEIEKPVKDGLGIRGWIAALIGSIDTEINNH